MNVQALMPAIADTMEILVLTADTRVQLYLDSVPVAITPFANV
jgi:hypothetical protein